MLNSIQIDPIEKKPFFHFHPGSRALSIATVGCNFRCKFCCNPHISQVEEIIGEKVPPKKIVTKGLYRFIRNPMYIGVLLLIIGWSIFFGSPLIFLYTIILGIGFHIRVVRFEEPWLKKEFGRQWEIYDFLGFIKFPLFTTNYSK